MRYGAILKTAAEVLAALEDSDLPVDGYLRHWGRSNRYAGSRDRARLAETVYGVLRRKSEYAWRMDSEAPRALVLAHHCHTLGVSLEALDEACDGEAYNCDPLSDTERAMLERSLPDGAADHVLANVPSWLSGRFDPRHEAVAAHQAMAGRAPLDLRINTLVGDRQAVLETLETHLATLAEARRPVLMPSTLSPWGIRLSPADVTGTLPDVTKLDSFNAGAFDVQDEGSQLVSLLAGATPGSTVIDLCAGGGGKTLALAAAMENTGRIVACDTDAVRLKNAEERAERAGVRCADFRLITERGADRSDREPDLADVLGAADLVFLDVPCSGSGTWRRAPDTKWRLTPDHLDRLTRVQADILERGGALTKPGGRLVYVTCSILAAENTDPIDAFLKTHTEFTLEDPRELWSQILAVPLPEGIAYDGHEGSEAVNRSLLLSPYKSATDGFFFASLRRKA